VSVILFLLNNYMTVH